MKAAKHSALSALIVAAIAVPISAGAQDRAGVTIAAGALSVTDTGTGPDIVVPSYLLSVQRVMKQHFVVEGEFQHWAHTRRVERGPHVITGPQGPIGTVTGSTTISSSSLWNVGANVLVRSTGRARVFGGGGFSLSNDDSKYSQQSFGCSPGLDPRSCDRYESHRWRGPIPLFRVLGGVDVPITRRIGIVGAFRWETSAWEDRANWASGVAGIRFAFY